MKGASTIAASPATSAGSIDGVNDTAG